MDDIFSLDLHGLSTRIVAQQQKNTTKTHEVIDLVSDDESEHPSTTVLNNNNKQENSKELNSSKRSIADDTFDLEIGSSSSLFSVSSPKRQKIENGVQHNNGNSIVNGTTAVISRQNSQTSIQPAVPPLSLSTDINDPQACLENLNKLVEAYELLQSLLLRKVERMSNAKAPIQVEEIPQITPTNNNVEDEPMFDTYTYEPPQSPPSLNNNNNNNNHTTSQTMKLPKRKGRPPKQEKSKEKLKEDKATSKEEKIIQRTISKEKTKEDKPKVKQEKVKVEPRYRDLALRPRRSKEAAQAKQSEVIKAGTLYRNTSAIAALNLDAEQERSLYRISQLDQETTYLKLESATLLDTSDIPFFDEGPKNAARNTAVLKMMHLTNDLLKKSLPINRPEILQAAFSNQNKEFCKYLTPPGQAILRPFVSDQVIQRVVQFMNGNREPGPPIASDPNHKYVHARDYGLDRLSDGDVIHVPFSPNEVDIIDEYLANKNNETTRNDNNNNDNNRRGTDFGFVQLSDEELYHVTRVLPGRSMQDVHRYIYGVVYQTMQGKTFHEKNVIVFRKPTPRYNGNYSHWTSLTKAVLTTQTTGNNYFTQLKEREYMSLGRKSTRKHQHVSLRNLASQYVAQTQSQMAGGPIVNCKFNTKATYYNKKSVAVCSAQAPNELVLYDILSGDHKVLQGHENTVSRIEFSHCGEYLISTGFDKAIRIWSAQSGDLYHTFEAANPENSVKGHNGPVELLALHNTSHRIMATAAGDKSLFLWDIEKLECASELSEQDSSDVLLDMTFCHGEYDHVLLGGCETENSANGIIKLWDTNLGSVMGITQTGHEGPISSLYSAPSGNTYYSGSNDSTTRIFDIRTNKEQSVCRLWKSESSYKVDVNQVSLSHCERYLQASCTDNRVYVFDQRFTQKVLHVLCHDALDNFSEDSQGVATAEWSKTGLLVTGGEDSRVRVWDVTCGQPELVVFENHNNTVSAVAISPEEDCIVSGGDESKVLLYSLSKLYKLSK